MKRRLIFRAAGGAALSLALLSFGCKGETAVATTQPATAAAEPEGVVHLSAEAIADHKIVVEPVKNRVLADTLRLPGRVSANEDLSARVGSPVAGRVVELRVGLGDSVRKGDPLFVVESPEYAAAQGEYLEKSTAVMSAEAGADAARKAAERAQKLFAQGQGVAESELQKRQADLSVAEATLKAARASAAAARAKIEVMGVDPSRIAELEASQKILTRLTIVSPVTGDVIDRTATMGQAVGPDRETLMVIADLAKPWILADLPQEKVSGVRQGLSVRVESTAGGKVLATGSVDRVSPAIDANTRAATVRMTLALATPGKDDDDDKKPATPPVTTPATTKSEGHEAVRVRPLQPGMFVSVVIELPPDDDDKPGPAVPESAVLAIEGKTVVFVAGASATTFVKREVRLGELAGGFYPVEGGLKEGERIVTSGAFLLKAELGKGTGDGD